MGVPILVICPIVDLEAETQHSLSVSSQHLPLTSHLGASLWEVSLSSCKLLYAMQSLNQMMLLKSHTNTLCNKVTL